MLTLRHPPELHLRMHSHIFPLGLHTCAHDLAATGQLQATAARLLRAPSKGTAIGAYIICACGKQSKGCVRRTPATQAVHEENTSALVHV